MKIDLKLLDAAAQVRTLRGLYDWLLDVISDPKTSNQAKHICTIFACAIEPLISLALIDADTSACIWATFERLRLELVHSVNTDAAEVDDEQASSDFPNRRPSQ